MYSLRKITVILQNFTQKLYQIISQASVKKAFRTVMGAIIPLVIAISLGYEQLGMELMLGVIMIAGADIKEPFRDKITSLLVATALIVVLTFMICLIAKLYWLLIPILFLIIFVLSYAAPFGTRYASVAFAGTLAIIIALSTYRLYQDIPSLMLHIVSLLAGSSWYVVYTLVIDQLTAKKQVKEMVADGLHQTTAYLQLRVGLFYSKDPLWQGMLALSEKQAELTAVHGEMREFLLQDLSQIRKPKSFQRRMMLIFLEQLEIMEAALATPLDYTAWQRWLKDYPELDLFPKISQCGIREMIRLTDYLEGNRKATSYQPEMQRMIDEASVLLQRLQQEAAHDPEKQTLYQHASNLRIYQEIQLKKLCSMESVLQGEIQKTDIHLDDDAYPRFLNARFVNWDSIQENFTLRSSYFRYALRTSVTAILGFMIGTVLGLENAYWVLLTVLVVMKPGYTVTRQRFIHRIAGTIGGAFIAYGLYLLGPSHTVSLIIFALSFFLAYCFVPHIYAVSTIFFTIYVVFLYSFLHKEIPTAVVYRVVDTTLGATLCYFALHFFWPSWEYQTFPYYLRDSLRANQQFFSRIVSQIMHNNVDLVAYRLARKSAYVLMANSVTSFQRFRTEPASKRKDASEYSDMLLLNYGILATISTMGVYLNRYPTASQAIVVMKDQFLQLCHDFDEALTAIDTNLSLTENIQKGGCKLAFDEWNSHEETAPTTSGPKNAHRLIQDQLIQLTEQLAGLKNVVSKQAPLPTENQVAPLLI